MKLITAVINKRDADNVCDALNEKGYRFTKITTQGGFLRAKNLTLLIGADDDNVEEALGIIRTHCKERKEPVPIFTDNYQTYVSSVAEVIVGGATVFVTDVTYFERM